MQGNTEGGLFPSYILLFYYTNILKALRINTNMKYVIKIPNEIDERMMRLSKQHGVKMGEEYKRALALYFYLVDDNEKGKVKQLTVERESGKLEEITELIPKNK